MKFSGYVVLVPFAYGSYPFCARLTGVSALPVETLLCSLFS